jgi:hypothetical protein
MKITSTISFLIILQCGNNTCKTRVGGFWSVCVIPSDLHNLPVVLSLVLLQYWPFACGVVMLPHIYGCIYESDLSIVTLPNCLSLLVRRFLFWCFYLLLIANSVKIFLVLGIVPFSLWLGIFCNFLNFFLVNPKLSYGVYMLGLEYKTLNNTSLWSQWPVKEQTRGDI